MYKLFLFTLFSLVFFYNYGQVFSIADGNVSTCNGVIHDTGGAGGPGYSNNESFTITVCSDDPNKLLTLNITNLVLDPTVGAGGPGAVDNIAVYDGNTATGTPVYTAQGTTVNGYLISPSPGNTSGCLTIVFTSNEVGTGSFTFGLACEFPCTPPTAAATSNPASIARICKGDVVNFDASGSTAQNGFNIDMYYWDYDDGNDEDSISGATTSFQFNNEGAYRVRLRVRDDNPDNRCFSTNAVEMTVLVAPDPVFNPLTVGGPVCLGESADLIAFPTQYPQTWTGTPYANLGGPQFIPDQVGQCFNSTITFGAFSPGQQLTSINDLLGITINFEHSYMGDLQISIICPTGQSVMMHNQGGGGTFLGIPVDNDSDNSPGIGWDYTWSPTATNGTWATNALFNSTLPSGTYESENPLSGLVGCDLNGTWQIQVCDLLGSDNGFIFNWGIDFDPSLFPGINSFTPSVSPLADSSAWTASADGVISADGNTMTVTPTTAGNHNYTYTITDNHGCTNDTTVTVTITPNPVVSIAGGPNAVACSNADFQLTASVSPNPGSVVYEWSPATGLSDPNISNPIATVSGNVTYDVKAYKTGHPLCFTTDQITLTVSPPPPVGTDFSGQYCKTDPAIDMFTLLGAGATPGGTWTNLNNGTTSTSIFNPAMQDSTSFSYEVVDANGCRDTAIVTMDVARPFVLNLSNDTTICENGTASLQVNPSGGFGAPFTETWDQGITGASPHNVTPTANQCYNVFVTDQNGCTSPVETVCVNVRPPLSVTTSGDNTICPNTNTLLQVLNVSGGNDGPYNYEWKEGNNVIANINQVNVSPGNQTQYCVTVSDNCETTPVTECLTIDMFPQPVAEFSADKVDGCYPIQVTFTNDTDPASVSSALWVFGNGATSTQLTNVTTVYGAPICYDVQLTVTSPDGCIDDTIMANYICPFDYPNADFNINPNPTTFFDTNIDIEDQSSSDVVDFAWDFGSMANPPTSTDQNNLVRYPSETIGEYPIFLTVTNADGCQDTITKILIVNSVFTMYVPNAFSPNGDGENDRFFIQGESISSDNFSLLIFDRDGHIVFETTDKNAQWDGTSKNGTELPQGVYIWKIEAQDIYSDDIRKSFGHVSLIR